ncbi:MAG TPA: isoprenylcysteine carboxylmethyltransferase family protein [Candidatus Marinimicrobia bacterium]|jgi:protein-S-isoprenylcysteine O-methyltransferase Ste14|nr:isoprenylcysteine carboxylmethyltransferase family protein [Candidatus Neomarinimicrobiota bacterium]
MDIRDFFFRNRGYIPIPLAIIILTFASIKIELLPIGVILVVTGELLRLNGVRYAGGETRTLKVGASVLCSSGPFAYLRNPLYLGNVIIYAGMVLIAGGEFVWILLPTTLTFFFLEYGLIISLEEETLRKKFNEEYGEYLSMVPRLIPRVSPWKGGSETVPMTIEKTLRTEKRTLQIIGGFILLLILRVTLL